MLAILYNTDLLILFLVIFDCYSNEYCLIIYLQNNLWAMIICLESLNTAAWSELQQYLSLEAS